MSDDHNDSEASTYTVAVHRAWRLSYAPDERRAYLAQDTTSGTDVVCLTLDQIPEVIRALRRLPREQSRSHSGV